MCGLSQRQRPRYRIIVQCGVNTESLLDQEQEFTTQGGFNNCGLHPHISLCCDEVGQHQAVRKQLKQLSEVHRVFSCCSCSLFVI